MGLVLDEPSADEETATHDGVTFMLAADLSRWLAPGRRIAIDHQPWRNAYSVYVVGQRSTC